MRHRAHHHDAGNVGFLIVLVLVLLWIAFKPEPSGYYEDDDAECIGPPTCR